MIVSLVPTEMLPKVWAQVAPLIGKSVDGPAAFRTTILDIYDWCLKGKYSLWIVADQETKKISAAWVTTVVIHPAYKALSIQYVGGDALETWIKEAMTILKRFAVDCGCSAIEACAREGWVRKLKKETDDEWQRVSVLIRLELDEAVSIAAE